MAKGHAVFVRKCSHPMQACSFTREHTMVSFNCIWRERAKFMLIIKLDNRLSLSSYLCIVCVCFFSAEKSFVCPQCNKGFNVKSNLLRHMRSCHNEVPSTDDQNESDDGMD